MSYVSGKDDDASKWNCSARAHLRGRPRCRFSRRGSVPVRDVHPRNPPEDGGHEGSRRVRPGGATRPAAHAEPAPLRRSPLRARHHRRSDRPHGRGNGSRRRSRAARTRSPRSNSTRTTCSRYRR